MGIDADLLARECVVDGIAEELAQSAHVQGGRVVVCGHRWLEASP
jgi:hypothetical protein